MTTYNLRSASPAKTHADAVVVGVLKAEKGVELAPGAEDVAKAYGRKLRPLLATLDVTGKAGEVTKVPTARHHLLASADSRRAGVRGRRQGLPPGGRGRGTGRHERRVGGRGAAGRHP